MPRRISARAEAEVAETSRFRPPSMWRTRVCGPLRLRCGRSGLGGGVACAGRALDLVDRVGQARMSFKGGGELRHDGAHGEPVDVPGVDAAEHGGDEPVQNLVAETERDQLTDGHVAAGLEDRQAVVGTLLGVRDRGHVSRVAGNAHHVPGGEVDEFAADAQRGPGGGGVDDGVAQAHGAGRARSPRAARPGAIRRRSRRASREVDGVDLAAQAHRLLRDDDLGFGTEAFAQAEGGGEAGDAAADDEDPRPSGRARDAGRGHRAHRDLAVVCSCTRSTTSLSFPGSVSGRTPWPRLKMWPFAALGGVEDGVGLGQQGRVVGEDDGRVEVALEDLVRQALRGLVERDAEVDAADFGAGLGHRFEQVPGADAEVDARHGLRDARERGGGVREHEAAVVGLGEGPGPGVEQLHGLGSGLDLDAQELAADGGEAGGDAVPDLGVGLHERLGLRVVAAGAALDEVGREGEGGAGESDERGVAEFLDEQADRFGDVGDVAGVEVAQALDVGLGAEGLGDDGAGAGDDLDVDADGGDRHDDVGEEDRGVHAVAAHGLHGDLGDEFGGAAGLEHGGARAGRLVLRERAPGLAHEPDGGPAGFLAAAGREERGGAGNGCCCVGHAAILPRHSHARPQRRVRCGALAADGGQGSSRLGGRAVAR